MKLFLIIIKSTHSISLIKCISYNRCKYEVIMIYVCIYVTVNYVVPENTVIHRLTLLPKLIKLMRKYMSNYWLDQYMHVNLKLYNFKYDENIFKNRKTMHFYYCLFIHLYDLYCRESYCSQIFRPSTAQLPRARNRTITIRFLPCQLSTICSIDHFNQYFPFHTVINIIQ